MAYLVLARKYRPKSFTDLVGQDHVSRTLFNAIRQKQTSQAYLFSGPRGVGKTTTARILARALNCASGPTPEPCGTCPLCREITEGRALDVQEIDGASNRGIDQIRDLRDQIRLVPAAGRYRVYVIDEVHMLTEEAFNALLKTLEEPPAHAVIIMATTAPHKVPGTILSRCQRFQFRPIGDQEAAERLEKVARAEKLSVDDEARWMIARAGQGSLRDSLTILDQAVSWCGGAVTGPKVAELLGLLPRALVDRVVEGLAARDPKACLQVLAEALGAGYDVGQFGRDLRDALREFLLALVGGEEGVADVLPRDRLEAARERAARFGVPWLVHALHLLSSADEEARRADHPRLILEVTLVKLAGPYISTAEILDRLAELESRLNGGPASSSPPDSPQARSSPPPGPSSRWSAIVESVQVHSLSLGFLLGRGLVVKESDAEIEVSFGRKEQVDAATAALREVEKAARQVSGVAFRVRFVQGTVPAVQAAHAAASPVRDESQAEPEDEAETETVVEEAGDSFPDEVAAPSGQKATSPRPARSQTESVVEKIVDLFGGHVVGGAGT